MKKISLLFLAALLISPHYVVSTSAQDKSTEKKERKKSGLLTKAAYFVFITGPWATSIYLLWQMHDLKKTLAAKEKNFLATVQALLGANNNGSPITSTATSSPTAAPSSSSATVAANTATNLPQKSVSLGSFGTRVHSGPGSTDSSPRDPVTEKSNSPVYPNVQTNAPTEAALSDPDSEPELVKSVEHVVENNSSPEIVNGPSTEEVD